MNDRIKRALRDFSREMGDDMEEPFEALDGITTLYVNSSKIVKALLLLKDHEEGLFDMLTDLTAVDWLPMPEKGHRFEVVYHLCSTVANHRIRLKVRVTEDDLTVPTSSGVYLAANWLEREVYDMFGITFRGHPDMRRILMWEGYEGHPLRKDFPVRGPHPTERTPYT